MNFKEKITYKLSLLVQLPKLLDILEVKKMQGFGY